MQEKQLLEICAYSHDYDGAVYEEKSCRCYLYRTGDQFFIRRHFAEKWDYDTVTDYTEDIPVKPEDLQLGVKKLSAIYCNGRQDNPWIDTYCIHSDADVPGQTPVCQMIDEKG